VAHLQLSSPQVETAVRLHILSLTRDAQPFAMIAAALLALTMLMHTPWPNVAGWWGCMFCGQLCYRQQIVRLLRQSQLSQSLSRRDFRRFCGGSLLLSLLWSGAPWWLVADNDPLYMLLVLLWLAAVAAAYAAYFSSVRPLFYLALLVLVLGAMLKLLLSGVPVLYLAALSCLLYGVALVVMIWPLHRIIRDSFVARDENSQLLTELSAQQQQLEAVNLQLEEQGRLLDEALVRVEELVAHDPLTGVLSRRAIMLQGERLLDHAGVSGQPFCLAMLDLDHFKSINDSFGHLVGDEVLRQTCLLLSADLRGSDSLGRYGGEEFMLLLSGVGLAQAQPRLEQMRLCLQQYDWSDLTPQRPVTLSIGLMVWQPGLDLAQLIHRADDLLYAAKRAGRNRVMVEQTAALAEKGSA
jgi:diguanylate cyclase